MFSGIAKALIITDLFGVLATDAVWDFLRKYETNLKRYVQSTSAPQRAHKLEYPNYYLAITQESEVEGPSSNERYYGELERASGVPAKEIERSFNDTKVIIENTVRLYRRLKEEGHDICLLTSTGFSFAEKFLREKVDGQEIISLFNHIITISDLPKKLSPDLLCQLGDEKPRKDSEVTWAYLRDNILKDYPGAVLIDDSRRVIDFYSDKEGLKTVHITSPEFDLETNLRRALEES